MSSNTLVAKTIPETLQIVAEELAARRAEGKDPILFLPGNAGLIPLVEAEMYEHPELLAGGGTLNVFQLLSLGSPEGWAKAVAGGILPVTPFIGPAVRDLFNKGLGRFIRSNLSEVWKLYKGRWRPDVAFAHVSPPDYMGRVTLGLNAGLDIGAVREARFKVAVINRRMPRWSIKKLFDPATGKNFNTGCAMNLADFDLMVEIDEPLKEHVMVPKESQMDEARTTASLILQHLQKRPGADKMILPFTFQLGIGAIPNEVAERVAKFGIKVKGIWSELFSDGVLNLFEKDLIEKTGGSIYLRDSIVVGFVLGSRRLYESMHENEAFAILPQEIVNDPRMIALNPGMVSINSALAVSLRGDVAAATQGWKLWSGIGGQGDFALGASLSEGGSAFIALPSVAKLRDGSLQSRVVAVLPPGANNTITSNLPVIFVTGQGIADLYGLDDEERAKAMLSVAHPDMRAQLAKEARLIPSLQGVGAIPSRLVTLRNGCRAVVRPATNDDIPEVKEYLRHLSKEDIRTRYMLTVSTEAIIEIRVREWSKDNLDFIGHAAMVLEVNGEIVGVAHAFLQGEEGHYEVSFSRRSDWQGLGVGPQLMMAIVNWAIVSGVKNLEAITYRSENPRMRALFDRWGFTSGPDPEDHSIIRYSANVKDLERARGNNSN